MVSFIILAIVFLILGLVFLMGKGSSLIAGYNTMGQKEKNKYNEKRLNKTMAMFCFVITIICIICFFIKDINTTMLILISSIIINSYCRNK